MSRCLYVVDPTSTLYTIDPATASAKTVGPVMIANVTDIAFHGPTLYGVSFSQLLKLDPETGKGKVVGPTGFTTNGLAVASDGTIYAAGATQLATLNPVTGAGTAAPGAYGPGLSSSGDLAFDSNDVLFGALNSGGSVSLAQIDRTSGAATLIGSTGLSTVYGLAFFGCRLYGTTANGELVDINVATGKATVIGKNKLTQWGMAARPCCCC